MSDNISFIIEIISGVGFISSEILPFIPIKGNGILHSICFYLSKLNNNNSKDEESVIKDKEFLDKLDKIIQTMDENDKTHSLLITKIKEKIDDMCIRIGL